MKRVGAPRGGFSRQLGSDSDPVQVLAEERRPAWGILYRDLDEATSSGSITSWSARGVLPDRSGSVVSDGSDADR